MGWTKSRESIQIEWTLCSADDFLGRKPGQGVERVLEPDG